jgi:hypothetical protein
MSALPRPSLRARALAWGGALSFALAAGVLAGCPFELDRGLSCGDGWWDPEYEECDPSDPNDKAYVNACREQGFAVDAQCDPQTCKILASEEDCNVCGDGIAFGDEQCDGEDLRGQSCAAGSGKLGCKSNCTFDYDDCPAYCGDNIVNGNEECEPGVLCTSDEDCSSGRTCYQGDCIEIGEGFAPRISCSHYETKAIGFSKPYASGTIGACVENGCFFGRNQCSFCGDGELDPEYDDLVAPNGSTGKFPAEVCDGEEAQLDKLVAHCEPLCVDDPINSDVVVKCDFECSADCQDFATPGDVVPPDPESLGCCLAKDSPCPNFDTEGVPNFPCCSWLEKPEWQAEKKCVASNTGMIPVTYVCP